MKKRSNDTKARAGRGGFALPAAIFALVVMGVAVTGGFFLAQQESKVSVATQRAGEALFVAERGAAQVIGDWQNSVFSALPLGSETELEGTEGPGEWTATVTRVSPTTYFLDAEGTVIEGGRYAGASRRLGMTLRVIPADLEPPAALTTRGSVRMAGSSEVNGLDEDPAGWEAVCATNTEDDKPGILLDPDGSIEAQGQPRIDGDPETAVDPTLSDESFTQFGDLAWEDLIAMADKTFDGGNINNTGPRLNPDGSCDQAHLLNWGDPLLPSEPCGGYFPVIYSSGDTRIQSGGMGQGILLVDGDLDLRGNFTFHGVVIVQGSFETQGSGNRIVGGVMASNANLEEQSLVGGSVVQQSTCASRRAILNNDALARPEVLTNRGWVDVSAVSYA